MTAAVVSAEGAPRTRTAWRALVDRALPALALAGVLLACAEMALLPPAEGVAAEPAAPHDVAAMTDRLSSRLDAATPADAAGWALLARSRLALGDAERADAAYARALALDANDAQLWAERAQVQVLRGQRADAQAVQAMAGRALAIDAKHALALALQGDAAFERGELARARERWSGAREHVAPGDAELSAALGRRLWTLNDAQRALGSTAAGTPLR